jgi:hypothetical protein
MRNLYLLTITFLQLSCATLASSDFREVAQSGLKVACRESNDLESSTETILHCFFENLSATPLTVQVESAQISHPGGSVIPYPDEQSRAAIKQYLLAAGAYKEKMAIGTFVALRAGDRSSRGASAIAGGAAAYLSSLNHQRKMETLLHAITFDTWLHGAFDIAPGGFVSRQAVVPYGMSSRGNRELILCLSGVDDCLQLPLNAATVARQRGP